MAGADLPGVFDNLGKSADHGYAGQTLARSEYCLTTSSALPSRPPAQLQCVEENYVKSLMFAGFSEAFGSGIEVVGEPDCWFEQLPVILKKSFCAGSKRAERPCRSAVSSRFR